MVAAAGLRDKARLMALATKESGAWRCQSLPFGNLLDNDSLRVSVAVQLCAFVCWPHKCRCGEQVEATGHHGLSCKRIAGRFTHHSSMNDVVKRALVSASVQAILEPPGLERKNGKRPDDIRLEPWKQGKL
jgi:hypothetical protein